MEIVVLDGYTLNPGDLSWDRLKEFGEVKVYEEIIPEETINRIKNAKYIFTNKTVINSTIMSNCPNLEYIGVLATGYNHVDVEFAKKNNITVCNISDYSTDAVAQLTFALILEITNSVGIHSTAVNNGEWTNCKHFSFTKTPLMELSGKTIGLIGFGKIGQKVAKLAIAFGMKVIVYSRTVYKEYENENLKFASLEKLLNESDIISLHCPLFNETKDIINKKSISKMKDKAILINTSRGGLIVEEDLKDALNNGKIYAAGLDVVTEEPIKSYNPLLNAENVYITPHIAWAGFETRKRLLDIAISNLEAYLNGKPINKV